MAKFNMDLYNKKEIPFEKDFGNNKELRRQIILQLKPLIEKHSSIKYTDEMIEALISDEKKLAQFNKARAFTQGNAQKAAIRDEIEKHYNVKMVTEYARIGYTKIKLPKDGATPEEIEKIHKENVETVLKYSDPRNAEKLLAEDTKNALSYDYSKIFSYTTDEAIDFMLNDPKAQFLFVFDSVFQGSGHTFALTNEFNEFINANKGIFQSVGKLQLEVLATGYAMKVLLPDTISQTDAINLMSNHKMNDELKKICEKQIDGFKLSNQDKEVGFSNICMNAVAVSANSPKIEAEVLKDILAQNGGKDYFYSHMYTGKDFSTEVNTLIHVKMALAALVKLNDPAIPEETKLMEEMKIAAAKKEIGIEKETNTEVIKKAFRDYEKNFKLPLKDVNKEEIVNITTHLSKDLPLTDIMYAEKQDFLAEKKLGKTTLASELKSLESSIVTKEDYGTLARVFAVIKSRQDNLKWYNFFTKRNLNNQMVFVKSKIEESGLSIKDFESGYKNLKAAERVEAVRKQEKIENEIYMNKEDFCKSYSTRSKKFEMLREAAPIVNEKVGNKLNDLRIENSEHEKRMAEMDAKLEAMYAEDPELKKLVEEGLPKRVEIKTEENNPVNEDINTNSNPGMSEKDISL